MPCYGVDTAPIEQMAEALGRLDIDLTDAEPDRFAAYAREHRETLQGLVELYLAAVACFFSVMRAIAARRLLLERETPSREQPARSRVDRTYLQGFLPLYDRASERALQHLRQLLMESFANDPELQASFIAQMVESGTVQEEHMFVSTVETAHRPEEAQEHGQSGKEIEDSIKEFLKSFISDLVVVRLAVKKKSIDRAFRLLNEILGMVFHGPGQH